MNLHECEKKAQEIGPDCARFIALFLCGPVSCQWLDADMGIFRCEIEGMMEGFVTTSQISEEYPDLFCTEPFVERQYV